MYSEDELLPLSALNHLLFCERRAALIHIEQIYVENRFTLEGVQGHERADREAEGSISSNVRRVHALPLTSQRLGLVGKADIVEFRPCHDGGQTPFPVEYKRGRRKKWDNDDVQLCAQAFCLEEMLGVGVPAGAIFHIKSKRRREVAFTPELRFKTEAAARRLHDLVASGLTPPPVLKPRCRGCSLRELCMPNCLQDHVRVRRYITGLYSIEHEPAAEQP